MSSPQTVLLVGGTGRTGLKVLGQLLQREVRVRAIVRSRSKIPAEVATHPHLTLIEADLLSLGDDELRTHLRGCDAVISCLGHVLTLKGVFGPPRDLVTQATARLCRAIEALAPSAPVKFILMSSVSVHRDRTFDPRRGPGERAFLAVLCALLPPARDNQRAADHLLQVIGTNHPAIEWVVVRPDSLLEGEVSKYTLHEGLVNTVFSPGATHMANIGHFMTELVTQPELWGAWRGKLPVIVNESPQTA